MTGVDLDELHECLDQILPLIAHARSLADRLAKAGHARIACSILVDMSNVLRSAADTTEADAIRLASTAVEAGEDRSTFSFVLD